MHKVKAFVLAGLACAALLGATGIANAEDIKGVIVRTLVLSENTRLVGDVTCTVAGAPCITFGTARISLNLNGFTISGQADAALGCKGALVLSESGISTNGQGDVGIRGPGIVQRFQGDGILFIATAKGWVQEVATMTNCASGIRISATSSEIRVEGNVSVRNGASSNPCGGI